MKRAHLAKVSGYAALVILGVSILLYGFLGKSFQTLALVHLFLAVFCFLAFLVLRASGALQSEKEKEGAVHDGLNYSQLLYASFVLGGLVFAGVLQQKHVPLRLDLTEEKVYSLSSHTEKVLKDLPSSVHVRVFSIGGEPPQKLRTLLDRYANSSKNFRWGSYDPDVHRVMVEKLGIQEKDTLHFSFQEVDSGVERGGILLARSIDEEGITNALIKLSRGSDTIVYIPQQYGEGNVLLENEQGYSFLKESIEGEGYTVQVLDFSSKEVLPLDKSLLLFLAPKKEYLPGEKKKIQEFLDAGGKAMFLLEPLHTDIVRDLLESKGFIPGRDTIVDKEAFTFRDGVMGVQPLVDTFSSHPSVKDFGKTILLSTAVSVRKKADADAVREIAFTSETSWAETDLASLYSETPLAEKSDEDIVGPVSIASVSENSVGEREQRLMVIGDLDFVSNVNIRQLFNRDFFLNSLNWVVGEDEGVKIRAGTLKKSQQVVTPQQFSTIFTIAGVIIPEIILLLGIGVWVSRR